LTPNNNVYGLWIIAHAVASTGVATQILLDIAYGGSDTVVIPNINVGYAAVTGGIGTVGKVFYFPGLNIPSGNAIKARLQSSVSNDTAALILYTEERARWVGITENNWVAYGANTGTSAGTSVPPGAGTFGTWTEIGTTSANHNLFTCGIDLLSTSILANTYHIEIGVGPNSGAVTSMGFVWGDGASSETLGAVSPLIAYPTSSGDKVWARAAAAQTQAIGVVIYGGG
jgi:hypothetical protein